MTNKIIFILPNIYESINGVSTKYIKFINYLVNKQYNIILFTPFKDYNIYNNLTQNDNFTIVKANGLTIPFYKDIKIPILKYSDIKNQIDSGKEIIIFNGEFIWLYNIIKKLKKKYSELKIYPNMHTDYIFYASNHFQVIPQFLKYDFSNLLKNLNLLLEKKIFNGIIVTGESLKNKYLSYTDSVFNANEINLDIFNSHKKDSYNNNFFNIIYCGRISKEKNLDELLECCKTIENYNYVLHIIGDGPYMLNIKDIISLEYKNISDKIIFHGSKSHEEINQMYMSLDNRIFLFLSISETFGKTPMEAGATGIPIFIKKCETVDILYINRKNAFIFEDKETFKTSFEYFIEMNIIDKDLFISNNINNIKKYDQNIIFNDWINFLINGNLNKNTLLMNIFDIFTFHSISKMINCAGNVMGD
jgi:1,2-diacylglycerol 3-alpha-glucosyltransferase